MPKQLVSAGTEDAVVGRLGGLSPVVGRPGGAWRGVAFLAVLLVCLVITVFVIVAIVSPSAGAAGGCGGG